MVAAGPGQRLGHGPRDAQVGGGAHHLDAHLGGGRHPGQVLGRAVERADVQEEQLAGGARVPQHGRHAQLGVLQLAAAGDEEGDQPRRLQHGDRLVQLGRDRLPPSTLIGRPSFASWVMAVLPRLTPPRLLTFRKPEAGGTGVSPVGPAPDYLKVKKQAVAVA